MANSPHTPEYHRVLLELAKSCFLNLEAALGEITRVDAHTLPVERVSVWLLNPERTAITCQDFYQRSTGFHQKGQALRKEQYPHYFSALEEYRTLAVRDARTDPRTSEFKSDYLNPNGITSMLDVPIWLNGEYIGIICHEHISSLREWSLEEQDFAASIADLVSLTIDSIHRRKAEMALRRAYDELEIRVRERTADLARANEKLVFLAQHDGLTDLPNRILFEDRLKRILRQCRRSGEKFGLMFIDMDYFKTINDRWGHLAGDAVLKEVAVRLKSCAHEGDIVARIGGDEFIFLLSHVQDREDIQLLRERIQRVLRNPIRFQGTHHQVTLSIGAAIYPDDGEETKALLAGADLALYGAKTAGRDTLQFYQHSSHQPDFRNPNNSLP